MLLTKCEICGSMLQPEFVTETVEVEINGVMCECKACQRCIATIEGRSRNSNLLLG